KCRHINQGENLKGILVPNLRGLITRLTGKDVKMSLHFNKYVPPHHCKVKFEFKSGTPVRVRTLNDGVYEGEVLATNHSNGSDQSFFELVNALKLGSVNEAAKRCQYVRFEPHELISVEVLGPPNVKSFIKKPEKLHQTFFVDSSGMFDKLVKHLQEDKPTEVGINFYGLDVGRGGDLFLVAEFYLWARGQPASVIASTRKNLKYKPLSDILVEFIGANGIPDQEVAVLKEFEEKEIHFNEFTHPLKELPVKDKTAQKWVAIQIKHLLVVRDAMTKRMHAPLVECISTNLCTHVGTVGRNEFHSSYDHSAPLSIPPTVINKFIPSKVAVSSTTATVTTPEIVLCGVYNI
ncbi:hypothetical protein Ocin01_04615, partial [Orchesella cincta]